MRQSEQCHSVDQAKCCSIKCSTRYPLPWRSLFHQPSSFVLRLIFPTQTLPFPLQNIHQQDETVGAQSQHSVRERTLRIKYYLEPLATDLFPAFTQGQSTTTELAGQSRLQTPSAFWPYILVTLTPRELIRPYPTLLDVWRTLWQGIPTGSPKPKNSLQPTSLFWREIWNIELEFCSVYVWLCVCVVLFYRYYCVFFLSPVSPPFTLNLIGLDITDSSKL